MGHVTRGIFKTCINVGFFKVGEVLQDLLRRHAAGKHFKHMAHRHSHTANCRLTTAHIRFDRDTVDRHGHYFIRSSEERNLILTTRLADGGLFGAFDCLTASRLITRDGANGKRFERSEAVERLKRLEQADPRDEWSITVENKSAHGEPVEPLERLEQAAI